MQPQAMEGMEEKGTRKLGKKEINISTVGTVSFMVKGAKADNASEISSSP